MVSNGLSLSVGGLIMQNSSYWPYVRPIATILHLYYMFFRLVSSVQQLILYTLE